MLRYKRISFILIFCFFFHLNSESSASLLEGFKTSKKATKVDQRRSVGSGSRSIGCEETIGPESVKLLVPKTKVAHRTLSERPNLYFYSYSDRPTEVSFALVNPQKSTPLFEQTISINKEGIQKIVLPQRVKLHRKTIYLWNLAIACDNPGNGYQEVLTAGIERVSISLESTNKLKNANSNAQKTQIYSDNGIWYETLDSTIDNHNLDYDEGIKQLLSILEVR